MGTQAPVRSQAVIDTRDIKHRQGNVEKLAYIKQGELLFSNKSRTANSAVFSIFDGMNPDLYKHCKPVGVASFDTYDITPNHPLSVTVAGSVHMYTKQPFNVGDRVKAIPPSPPAANARTERLLGELVPANSAKFKDFTNTAEMHKFIETMVRNSIFSLKMNEGPDARFLHYLPNLPIGSTFTHNGIPYVKASGESLTEAEKVEITATTKTMEVVFNQTPDSQDLTQFIKHVITKTKHDTFAVCIDGGSANSEKEFLLTI